MAFCEICNDTGAVPQDMTNGEVTKWKDCPDLECKAHREAIHKGQDKVQKDVFEARK